ncbi:MoaF-related domain-containing protein [Argonema antarcticum]|uniref:MoaF-related domain-containing protein n=1 Tax=Argonema antarcticum TaxID=2942763 RepID=UPI002011556F|nr:MoaF N-terminal domain-containing protein [Argonema antarcticum]MCL1471276.1 PT domain-containing protein [Argonema antarcticum A004/B2]
MKAIKFVLIAVLAVTALAGCTQPTPPQAAQPTAQPTLQPQKVQWVGKTFLIDFGELKIKAQFPAANKYKWEYLTGNEKGKTGSETIRSVEIRPNVHINSWVEKDGTAIVEVLDLEKMTVLAYGAKDKKINEYKAKLSEMN